MLEKITAFLLVLLLLQLALFANDASELKLDSVYVAEKMIEFAKEGEDIEVAPLLMAMGIKTRVDEQLLDMQHPGAEVETDPTNGNATVKFNNPDQKSYRLDIYDVNKGLVASFVNVNSEEIKIEKELFNTGAYIYKLRGESNTYCGTFMLK